MDAWSLCTGLSKIKTKRSRRFSCVCMEIIQYFVYSRLGKYFIRVLRLL